MSKTVIKVENLSKQYRLGQVGTGTLSHDLNRWWARVRGKEDPFKKVTATNDRTVADGSEYVWALKDINFEVKEGEILGIIGKNGAGKSTLLKILSKVTGPTTGTIKTKGRIASLLEVGTGFHPEMTGRENIFMNGTLNGMNRHEIRAKLDEIVDFAGVAKYLDTPTKRYSSGMTVRLGFAVAAFLEPEILVVDEVLAVGDAEFQKKAIGKMQDVSKGEGRTVLFVSHNMAAIQSLCVRLMVLNQGNISFDGATLSGINYYLSNDSFNVECKSLTERTDRSGGHNFRFETIAIYDGDIEVDKLISGGSYEFRLGFSLKHPESIAAIRMIFRDSEGFIRILCNSSIVSNDNLVLSAAGYYQFHFLIHKFPLPAGNYSIDLASFSIQTEEDNIEKAIMIDVEDGDFYGNGRLPRLKHGVLIEYTGHLIT